MLQINWLHALMALIIIFIIGVIVGWFYPRPIKIEYRTSPPQVITKTVKVYIKDSSGTVIERGSASFDPQVYPFENVYKFDNSTVTTNASVTVGMIDNKLSVGMVEAARKEGQEPRQLSNIIVGGVMTTRGDIGGHIGYKLFETPPFLGLPAIDWTAGIVILK